MSFSKRLSHLNILGGKRLFSKRTLEKRKALFCPPFENTGEEAERREPWPAMSNVVSFDEEFSIRALDPEKFQEAERLKETCSDFLTNTKEFNDAVSSFLGLIETKAKHIEAEKMRAIGLRNLADMEVDVRKRREQELQALVDEKRAELER
jgi:intraflagellar transport protein 20